AAVQIEHRRERPRALRLIDAGHQLPAGRRAPELYFAGLELEHCRWIVGRLHSGSPLRLACPSEERLGDRDDWHAGCRERSHLLDRKSTRLNSSHGSISYAVFCLKKKSTTRS